MPKRLVFLVLLLCAGSAVFGQNLTGTWSAQISLLPLPVSLSSAEFTLKGKLFDWTVGGTAEFMGTDGLVWQTFFIQGGIGLVSSEWTLLFGPLAPAFLYAYGKYSIPINNLNLVLHTAMVGPNGPYTFTGGPSGGAVVEVTRKLNGLRLSAELGFGTRKQDFLILYSGVGTYQKILPVDPFPGGLRFTYLKLVLEGVPLCCGISADLGFAFAKAGFDSLIATAKGIPLCCGISFDAEVGFTTTAKTASLKPKWAGIEGCFTVYGDAIFVSNAWQGIEIYGFKVRCDFGGCTYAEFLTALNVAKVEEILKEDIFQNDEFEYMKLGFCGPGCCGGNWTLDLSLFFQPSGSLFGLSRILLDAAIPVIANLQVNLGLALLAGELVDLAAGWTLTF